MAKMTEIQIIGRINQYLSDSETELIDKYIGVVKKLMELNHFSTFSFDCDCKPNIVLPVPPHGYIYDNDEPIFLNKDKPIFQENGKLIEYWIWGCGDYRYVEISSIKITRKNPDTIFVKPILNFPYDKERFEIDKISMTKDGFIDVKSLPFSTYSISRIVWYLLDQLPKVSLEVIQ